jgi:hypothetical protein
LLFNINYYFTLTEKYFNTNKILNHINYLHINKRKLINNSIINPNKILYNNILLKFKIINYLNINNINNKIFILLKKLNNIKSIRSFIFVKKNKNKIEKLLNTTSGAFLFLIKNKKNKIRPIFNFINVQNKYFKIKNNLKLFFNY